MVTLCYQQREYYSAFLSISSEFENDHTLRLLLKGQESDHQIIINKLYTLEVSLKNMLLIYKALEKTEILVIMMYRLNLK